MPPKNRTTLDVRTRDQWRSWLREHHDSASEIWLVFHKRHTATPCLEYDDAVEEALCFGWIDSLIKRLDDDRYARKFTPRNADSAWSTINRKRYARLKAAGLLEAPGVARPPTGRSGDLPRPAQTPADLEQPLKANARAWRFFEQLAPSHRRAYVVWIDSAKRDQTRQKRLRDAIARLSARRKPGLK